MIASALPVLSSGHFLIAHLALGLVHRPLKPDEVPGIYPPIDD